jgi:hypothetical protein
MYGRSSGKVLSNRAQAVPDGFANVFPRPNPTKRYEAFPINYQATDPYNYLMFHTYGGGNNIFNADGTGEMGDAIAWAARMDYAVASNLNVWASYMRARRLEAHGHYAGQYGTLSYFTLAGYWGNNTAADARAWKAGNLGGTAADISPFVDDDYIGWEMNLGVDWKLLEGLNWSCRYAYWNPGGWFDGAYKAYTTGAGSPNGGTGLDGDGLLVGRSPIQAFETTLKVEF